MNSSLQVIALAATLLLPTKGSLFAGENLLPEGNFETLTPEGTPEGWKFPHPNYLSQRSTKITIETETDNKYLRIQTTAGVDAPQPSAKLDLPSGAVKIKLNYRIRAKNLVVAADPSWSGAFMGGHFENAEGKILKPFVPEMKLKADFIEWLPCEDSYEVPAGAVRVVLQPGLYQTTGTLDVDDVQVSIQ